jgi:hypothetical protein
MKTLRRGLSWSALVVGLALAGANGCQTWVPGVGMTLPSGRYLQHNPQYIPPTPDFPLPKELASMEAQAAVQGGPPLPAAAVPAVPAPPPAPAP